MDELLRQVNILRADLCVDVEVAVSSMAEDAGVQAEAIDLGAREAGMGGKLGERNAHVGRALLGTRESCSHGVRGIVARLPEPGPRIGIDLVCDVGSALRLCQRPYEIEIGSDCLGAPRCLDKEAWRKGVVGTRVGVDRINDPGVEKLDPRHPSSCRDEVGSRLAGALDVRKRDPQRHSMLLDRVQPHSHLGDHGERSLRSDEQACEVVPGRGLRGLAAGADDAPIDERRLECEHVRAHLSVAHGRRPRGVRRRHAAEGRVGTGIDREEEAVLASRAGKREPGDAGLHRCGQVLGGDRDDPVEPGEVESDATVDRNHVPLEARADAERRYGDGVLVGDCEHVCDLVGRAGIHDEVRSVGWMEAQVTRVEVELRRARLDVRVADDRRDRFSHCRQVACHLSQSAGLRGRWRFYHKSGSLMV